MTKSTSKNNYKQKANILHIFNSNIKNHSGSLFCFISFEIVLFWVGGRDFFQFLKKNCFLLLLSCRVLSLAFKKCFSSFCYFGVYLFIFFLPSFWCGGVLFCRLVSLVFSRPRLCFKSYSIFLFWTSRLTRHPHFINSLRSSVSPSSSLEARVRIIFNNSGTIELIEIPDPHPAFDVSTNPRNSSCEQLPVFAATCASAARPAPRIGPNEP